jgi:hypothetical protein
MKTVRANEILRDAAKKYEERNKVYGDNYLRTGEALKALFPDGLKLETAHDQNRFQIFNLIMVKLSRYVVNWNDGGHQDSIHDAAVYCAMLEAIDTNGPVRPK